MFDDHLDIIDVFCHISETQILTHCLQMNKISNWPGCDIVNSVCFL